MWLTVQSTATITKRWASIKWWVEVGPTWAIGLPDFSSQVVGGKCLLRLFHAHVSLLFGKAWWYFGSDCPVLHRHLIWTTTRQLMRTCRPYSITNHFFLPWYEYWAAESSSCLAYSGSLFFPPPLIFLWASLLFGQSILVPIWTRDWTHCITLNYKKKGIWSKQKYWQIIE